MTMLGHRRIRQLHLAIVIATTCACAGTVNPTSTPGAPVPMSSWWERPDDLATRDLFNGPWGARLAPDPQAVYTFVRPKTGGVNPGLVVRDEHGREWHVKQAPPRGNRGDEGPVEVTVSRVLSGLGFHQPPVYYLPAFTLRNGPSTHVERGGRFRLDDPSLESRGEWSWHQNPFIGQKPYQGLLVILLTFNSSDLKDSNNTLYHTTDGSRPAVRYVVRDLGVALGESGVIAPKRNNLEVFSRTRFMTGVSDGFVTFDYHGLHKELVRQRITPEDVAWASALMAQLTDRQWHDAFRAGGYPRDVAAQYIAILRGRIADGRRLGGRQAATE
jgi:hypothetical protein